MRHSNAMFETIVLNIALTVVLTTVLILGSGAGVVDALALAENAHAADSKAAAPRTLGPYLVGVKTELFVDQDRTCAMTHKKRTLVTEIWYPAAKSAADLPVNRFEQFWINPTGVLLGKIAIYRFGGNFVEVNERFKNMAHRDADIADGKFPLLIFSHGNGGFRHQNTFQMEYLASHGYIVAACDHTGNAAVTILPDQPVLYNKDTIKKVELWDDRPKDISFLISHLTQLNKQEDHWLAHTMLTDQIGVLGHSFGGFAVCRVAELDDRVKAILPMTVAGTLHDVKTSALKDADAKKLASLNIKSHPCHVPLMVILGDQDRTVGKKGNDRSASYFRRAAGPKYLLIFKDAGHFTFTELLQVNPTFGDGIGTEAGKDGAEPFQFSAAAEDQRITNQYSAAFFNAYLKQDAASLKFIQENHYPTELQFETRGTNNE